MKTVQHSTLCGVLFTLMFSLNCPAKTWWYVNPDATGNQQGYSWENAFLRFEDALAVAEYGDEIELCQGTFTPDTSGFANPRDAAFVIPAGVLIEGGHEGVDNGGWDPDIYITILSGDLAGDDMGVSDANQLATASNRSDNAYHIVTISGADPNTIFDGITFKGGCADGVYSDDQRGAAAFCDAGGSTFNKCEFMENYAFGRGGVVYANTSPCLFNECLFTLNAAESGAAVYAENSSTIELTDCEFVNHDTTNAGTIRIQNSSALQMTNCDVSHSAALSSGAGLYADSSTVSITGCQFSNNIAGGGNNGGAISFYSGSQVSISGSSFTNNTATADGGAINGDRSTCHITQSIFTGNSTVSYGGAVKSYGCAMDLAGCVFTSNASGRDGGAVYGNTAGGTLPTLMTVQHCRFASNTAEDGGGLAISSTLSEATVANCEFDGNIATDSAGGLYNNDAHADIMFTSFLSNKATDTNLNGHGGGTAYNSENASGTISDCIYIGNYADYGGGGGHSNRGEPNYIRCVFKNNKARFGAGAQINYGSPLLQNCLIIGNTAYDGGSGINCYYSSPTFINCTIADNLADYRPGFSSSENSEFTLINCIVWGNVDDTGQMDQSRQIHEGALANSITNCCIQGWDSSLGGVGNFGDDPLFVQSGSWIFGPDDQSLDDDTCIEGDCHLQSQAGSFSSAYLVWKADAQSSPCIDAGRTSDNYNLEPMPNGGRINIGAYGNTVQASKSGTVFCDVPVTADISGDCVVDLDDLLLLAQNWLAGK